MKPAAESDSEGELTFDEFFLAEYDRLLRTMWLLTGNREDGEDLAQEAMARVFERWDKLQRATDPVAYTYRIAFNLNRRRLRTLIRSRLVASRSLLPRDPLGEVTRRTDVIRAVRRLPRRQRETLLLVEWLGLSAEEASKVLGVEAVSIRVRLHRARHDLARMLGGSDEWPA